MNRPISIFRRPFDIVLLLFFAHSIIYGALVSLPESLGYQASPDSPWPPLRLLYNWSVAQEPGHLDPSPSLIATAAFDGFLQTPLLLFIVYGLIRQRPWLRTLSMVYAGAGVTDMFIYFVTTFVGPNPPQHPAIYLPFNLPWLIFPAVLALRMLRQEPYPAQERRPVAA